jgi:calcium/calmodulin-dependent protein kinase I
MQAILDADYSFTPEEYWSGVSDTARTFIGRCLTIDPQERMTAHEALNHPWVREDADFHLPPAKKDLLPTVKRNFNARVKLHAAIDTVRAINQLRAGQQARLLQKNKLKAAQAEPQVEAAAHHDEGALKAAQENAKPGSEGMDGVEGLGQLSSGDGDRMEIDSGYASAIHASGSSR